MSLYRLELDDHELANLRALLEAIRPSIEGGSEPCPLDVLDAGEWIGSLLGRLPSASSLPAASAAELRRAALDWPNGAPSGAR